MHDQKKFLKPNCSKVHVAASNITLLPTNLSVLPKSSFSGENFSFKFYGIFFFIGRDTHFVTEYIIAGSFHRKKCFKAKF